jgi:cell division protein FtsQ
MSIGPAQTFKVTLMGTLVLSVIFAFNQINLSNYFPIRTVRVYGVNRIDHQEVQDLLLPIVDKGFFGINVEYIRDRLLQIPWVSDLYVRRVWPDQIEITVVEKKAVAAWNNVSLLSDVGDLFFPKFETYPLHIPKLIGPPGQQIVMLRYFKHINRLLLPLHAKISSLELTPYFTWKLTLNNGMILQMGHKDILTRLDHFVKVYPKIVGSRVADVDYVDLRYPHGVAVRWKA